MNPARTHGRFDRARLLAGCLMRALLHGAADKVPAKAARIIVVPSGKLGDVVCTTPVLRALRVHLPEAHLIVAGTSKLHQPLLADSGLVDEYLDLEEGLAIKRIKVCRADAALVTGPSFATVALLYLAGVPLVVAPHVVGGYSPSETRPYKVLKHFITTFPYRVGAYAPHERLRALEPLSIVTDDTKKQLGFSKAAHEKVGDFFTTHGLNPEKDLVVGISPSAGNTIKEWPVERFAAVADYLVEKYRAKVVIIGSDKDKEKAAAMLAHASRSASMIDTTGLFDLDELKALIARLSLFVSVDTGPIYIAEAFGVPTVDITGPIDEKEQPPRGRLHRNVVPLERSRPQLFVLNARYHDREEVRRQISSITVSAVNDELDLLVGDIKRQGDETSS